MGGSPTDFHERNGAFGSKWASHIIYSLHYLIQNTQLLFINVNRKLCQNQVGHFNT